ncbi:MAG: acyltransferase [Saprospirales bacterium]|nr:acyltransferase [Saprospirales bacterium]
MNKDACCSKKIFTIEIDYSKRIYGFDVFRGIGVFIVVYGHGRQFTPFLPTFNSFLSVIGFWLMDLFFIQSGYLIGSILIKTYEKEKLFNLKTAYNFWIRRWLRTLPTYYLVLIIAGCLWMLQGNYIFLKLKFIGYLFFYKQ